jgi:hypothetical protein
MVAPSAAPIWMRNVATPPPAPVTRIRRPGSAPASRSARQAVRPARGRAAHSSHDHPAGHAQDAEPGAGGVLALAPVERRVDHDLVAGRHAVDTRADGRDDPRAVGSEDRGQRAGPAFADPHVAVVERRPHEVDPHLARAGLRVGDGRRPEHLRPAERRQVDDPHASSPKWSARASKMTR